ncbi:hypothetical protein PPACK8108_LOCUS15994 [Phakopsora pachyrhizi]|uniref:Uncharacterized protein n=1 Tax=Phakopsora pachyrhizi TaxID=170000 RepID=A0AAV0BAQ8_PHAPC|nr:hypothetical protein PPACK8108_LOCUS15994 [Phakopsora pachyrhizi]
MGDLVDVRLTANSPEAFKLALDIWKTVQGIILEDDLIASISISITIPKFIVILSYWRALECQGEFKLILSHLKKYLLKLLRLVVGRSSRSSRRSGLVRYRGMQAS